MKIDKQNGNVAIDKLDSNNVNKVCGIYKIIFTENKKQQEVLYGKFKN